MTIRRRRLLLGLGIPLAVLLLALLALRLFLPLDRVRELAVARLSERLGREVTVGDVKLSLRGGLGIELRDVAVGDPPGHGAGRLLAMVGADLKLELAPLLRREVRVHRLVLRAPRLSLWRDADGTDNFTFDAASEARPDGAAAAGGTAGAEGAVALSVAKLEVRDGALAFRDEAAGTGVRVAGLRLDAGVDDAPGGGYHASGEVSADSLLVAGDAPLPPLAPSLRFDATYAPATGRLALTDGRLALLGLELGLSGEAATGGAAPRATGRLEARQLDVPALMDLVPPAARAPLEDVRLTGRLDLTADVGWDGARAEPLDYTAHLEAHDLVAGHASFAAEARVPLLTADVTPDHLRVGAAAATVAGQQLAATAEVRGFAAPRLNAHVTGTLDLAALAPLLPPEQELELGGGGTLDLRVQGPAAAPDSLDLRGTLVVTGGRVAAPALTEPVTDLAAELVLAPDALTLRRCTAIFPSGDVAVTGTLRHPRSLAPGAAPEAPRADLAFTASARRFDVDRLFPAAAPAAPGSTARPARGAAGAPPPTMPDLTAAGTFAVDTLLYSGVAFTRVHGDAVYRDRTVVCDSVQARVYGGTATGSIRIDLSDLNEPRYEGSFRSTGIQAASFLTRFSRFGDLVTGEASLAGSFAAAGRDPERVKSTLTLDAQADLRQGRVRTGGAVQSQLATLAGKAGLALDREQTLSDLATHVQVADGKVALERLSTALGGLGDLAVDGHYSFTGDLQYRGVLRLTPEVTRKLLEQGGLVGRLLGDGAPERLELPLDLGGTLQDPRLQVDYGALTSALQQGAVDEAGGRLQDLLRKKLGK